MCWVVTHRFICFSVRGLSSGTPASLVLEYTVNTTSLSGSRRLFPVQSTAPDAALRRAEIPSRRKREGAPCCRIACLSSARLDSDKAATRDWRAAETLPSRQARLDSDKASTWRRRQAQNLESSITAKHRNSLRAELRRQAADDAAARCAGRDATRSNAFEHLLWLHSCSGSLGVMNARRLFHLKKASASAALEIAHQDVLADIPENILTFVVSSFGSLYKLAWPRTEKKNGQHLSRDY